MRDKLTSAILHLVLALNRCKSRELAHVLHRMADLYDPRPTGQWEPKDGE
jgi:hypothetical protein